MVSLLGRAFGAASRFLAARPSAAAVPRGLSPAARALALPPTTRASPSPFPHRAPLRARRPASSTSAAAAARRAPSADDPASAPPPPVVDATSDDPGALFADLRPPAVHPEVTSALARLGFARCTGLQSRAIPVVGAGGDAVVAAETGSGKTLAYLVPVFSNLLSHGARNGATNTLGAVILAPNATLVEQVARVARSLVDDEGVPLLSVAALTPNDAGMPNAQNLPDVVVATPARAVEDVCRFSEGGWRRGNFSPTVPGVRHVVFDEADMLLGGGYLKPVRALFDVLYREEKLAAMGLVTVNEDPGDEGNPSDRETIEPESEGWTGDADRAPATDTRAWRDEHDRDLRRKESKSIPKNISTSGPALGGKGRVGVGAGREFRRQYVFAAATVMSSGKKTPGAMIRYGFPDATWVEGRRLHRSVASVRQTWIAVDDRTRADELGRALGIDVDELCDDDFEEEENDGRDEGSGSGSGSGASTSASPRRRVEKTMVFVNSGDACEAVAAELARLGIRAASFHSSVDAADRQRRLELFAAGGGGVEEGGGDVSDHESGGDGSLAGAFVDVLVCTDSAARGVDVPGVAHVVQAEFAGNAAEYLHRIGRTARCGASGRVTNLFSAVNAELVKAVRKAEDAGRPVEEAFSRKRSFRKKFKKYGESRTAPQNRRG